MAITSTGTGGYYATIRAARRAHCSLCTRRAVSTDRVTVSCTVEHPQRELKACNIFNSPETPSTPASDSSPVALLAVADHGVGVAVHEELVLEDLLEDVRA
jgi:hypothetical protein